jgi:polyhydroxyalkanoate synthesis regulator phasin
MEEVDKGEIPKSKELKSKLDEWLSGNVVEPMAKAGYPNVGAGIATVPSSIAEFLTPESPYELAPGMAGVGKLERKARHYDKKLKKMIGNINLEEVRSLIKDLTRKINNYDHLNDLDKLEEYVQQRRYLNNIYDRAQEFKAENNISLPNLPMDDINYYKIKGKNTLDDFLKKAFNQLKGKSSNNLINVSEDIIGETPKPYLRPKGYAKQPKTAKQAPMSKLPSRQDYDQMLQGKTDPNYYDRLREEFYNREEELSPLERFLKGKGDQ